MQFRRKPLVLAGCAIAHAALLALLLRAAAPQTASVDLGVMGVSLVAGAGQSAAPSARRAPSVPPTTHRARLTPSPPPDVTPQVIEVSLPERAVAPRDPLNDPVAQSIAAAGASGGACQIGAWLQSALQADPQVQAALLAIPRPDRSVSNALMLWEGGWVAAPPRSAGGIDAIRGAVVSGLRAAPDACRHQLIHGPELLLVSNGADTTVIAVGSGDWRWEDLLQDAPSSLALNG